MNISTPGISFLFSVILLPVAGSMLSITALQGWHFEHVLGHSVLEGAGALIALVVVLCIVIRKTIAQLKVHEVTWIAAGLSGMGLLDLFHALVLPGNNFVWFHSMATFTGGVFFACIWIESLSSRLTAHICSLMTLFILILSGWSAYSPGDVPSMVIEGKFTLLSRFLNIVGGIGFIISFVYFLKRYAVAEYKGYYLLAAHCLLFGIAGLLFELSALWDAAWWWWHILRFAAYLVLVVFFFGELRKHFHNPIRSLRSKIILLVCAVAVFVSIFVGGLNYLRTVKNTLEAAVESLAAEAHLLTVEFMSGYQEMENDAFVVSRTPPIKGMMRSMKNDHIDHQGQSTTALWRARLETIFMSVMEERRHYTQMRYIGIADQGWELARVNRVPSGFERVPESDLQQKAGEPYMKSLLKLAKNEVYFSEVTYNREEGEVDPRRVPTVRTIIPIFLEEKLFGAIVINADYPAFLRRVFEKTRPDKNTLIVTHKGDFMEYDGKGVLYEFQFHDDPHYQPADFIRELKFLEDRAFSDEDVLGYFSHLNITPTNPDAFIGAIVRVPKKELLADAYKTRNQTLVLSLILVIVSLLLAMFCSRRFSEPLQKMTKNIADSSGNGANLDLPVELQDEIGELARSFRQTIDNLLESEMRAKLVLDMANDGVITINEKGIVSDYNAACEEMFGYRPDEVIGENIKMLMPEPDHTKHDDYIAHYYKTGERKIIGIGREVEGKRKDGSTFPIDLSVSEVLLKDRRLFTGIIRDITERKEAEEEKEELIEKLSLSNKELDEFAYVASHDLKAPLRVIDNASRWLEEDLGERLDEESRENMELLRGRVSRMEKLLDDLLEYSRIGRKMNQDYDEISSGKDLMNDITLLLAAPEGFSVQFDPEFLSMHFNRMPLKQILLNLINNALKHHDKETGKIEVKVKDRGDHYRFSVADDGPGIAPEFQEKVFKMFQTLKPRDKVEGSGMGLAMVKKHIEHFGQTITLESEEGKGCVFHFTWPKDQRNIMTE